MCVCFVCQVLDTGWADLLAPSLDQLVGVCTAMENWLQTHPKHVLVLHCRVNIAGFSAHTDADTLFKYERVHPDCAVVLPTGRQRPARGPGGVLHPLQQHVGQVTLTP